MKTAKECVNKIARLDSIIEKHSAYLSMSKKDLALWTIWFARGQRLKQKIIESYAKEIAIKAYVLGACDEANEKYNPLNPEVRFNTWYTKLKQQ